MNTKLTDKQIAALDKKIEALHPKISKAKKSYDDLVEQLSELIDQRYPERKAERQRERLWNAYIHSNKDIDFIIDFIENAPDDDDSFWS